VVNTRTFALEAQFACNMAAATTAGAPAGESTSPVTIVCVGMAGETDIPFL
jgi:hypothetical protein